MNKSIPISLAIIAISVASVAGTYLYDRAQVANALEARKNEFAIIAEADALQQRQEMLARCRAELTTLRTKLTDAQINAAQYAPSPNIKDPETLQDVQAILYKKMQSEITPLKDTIARLAKECG